MSITLCGEFKPSFSGCRPWRRKKKQELAVVAQQGSTLLLLSAQHIHISGLLEPTSKPAHCDIYVFDREFRYVSASGPSLRTWAGVDLETDEVLGRSPFDFMPESFARTLKPLYERTLRGKASRVCTIWQGQTYLLTFWPLVDLFNKPHKPAGGVMITQPCEGMVFELTRSALVVGAGPSDSGGSSDESE